MSISEQWTPGGGLADPLVQGEDPVLKKADEEKPTGPLKSDSVMRWPVLALACIAMIGNYYCFDNPAALKTSLTE